MEDARYSYVIVGAGRAGCAAAEGIRELDVEGSVLLLNGEEYLPYDRPPLTKKLWWGKQTLEDVVLHDGDWYSRVGVDLVRGRAVDVDAGEHTLSLDNGHTIGFGKLLLATGATPRRLTIPGAGLPGVIHFRTLDDYLHLRRDCYGKRVVVIGGGFIGSELAASLSMVGAQVTLVFPGQYLMDRLLPAPLGAAMMAEFRSRGIRVLDGMLPRAIEEADGALLVALSSGEAVPADQVVVGIGVTPDSNLAAAAGLDLENGIVVDELLRTSHPDILAAGDNAFFPYLALGMRTRVEHWDNALQQGRTAGRNMAGAADAYAAMPYFFSDLFDFGFEAVGEVDARMEIVADWRDPNHMGVIYYLRDDRVRGVMLCNTWGRLDSAREMILRSARTTGAELHGALA